MQDMQNTLPVGTILQGRYLVQGLLGSSPYGAVYVVKDQYVKPDLFNLLVLKEVVNFIISIPLDQARMTVGSCISGVPRAV